MFLQRKKRVKLGGDYSQPCRSLRAWFMMAGLAAPGLASMRQSFWVSLVTNLTASSSGVEVYRTRFRITSCYSNHCLLVQMNSMASDASEFDLVYSTTSSTFTSGLKKTNL